MAETGGHRSNRQFNSEAGRQRRSHRGVGGTSQVAALRMHRLLRLITAGTTLVLGTLSVIVLPAASPASASTSSWNVSTSYPAVVTRLMGISCSSSTICEAVGSTNTDPYSAAIVGTADGGTTWTTQTAPSGISGLFGISCPSSTICEAVGFTNTGSAIVGTADGGTTWTTQTAYSRTIAQRFQ